MTSNLKERFYSVQALGEQRIFITKNKILFIFIGNKHGLPGAGFKTEYNAVKIFKAKIKDILVQM
jgi:hypothetical protein